MLYSTQFLQSNYNVCARYICIRVIACKHIAFEMIAEPALLAKDPPSVPHCIPTQLAAIGRRMKFMSYRIHMYKYFRRIAKYNTQRTEKAKAWFPLVSLPPASTFPHPLCRRSLHPCLAFNLILLMLLFGLYAEREHRMCVLYRRHRQMERSIFSCVKEPTSKLYIY